MVTDPVAVGPPVTRRPPLRSLRAVLPRTRTPKLHWPRNSKTNRPGHYRHFAYALDGKGKVGTANLRFRVR